jgi:hypothetical protein
LKKIDTLVKDIQERLLSDAPYDDGQVHSFGTALSRMLVERLANKHSEPSLRLSNLGTPCDRKLWYSINKPSLAEPLSASARLKFLFGDIIEHLLLFLSRASGHTVDAEQAEVNLHGVKGHIDAVIDGELVDCKSASSFSFKKFRDHGLVNEDAFGYRTQLNGYLHALTSQPSQTDGTVDDKTQNINPDRAHFLAVDKTLGHICLDTHGRVEVDYEKMVESKRKMLSYPVPPSRGYKDVQETYYRKPTGNRKLGVECSYCPFKAECWPGLRVFIDDKPTYYTHYVKEVGNKKEVKLEEARED